MKVYIFDLLPYDRHFEEGLELVVAGIEARYGST